MDQLRCVLTPRRFALDKNSHLANHDTTRGLDRLFSPDAISCRPGYLTARLLVADAVCNDPKRGLRNLTLAGDTLAEVRNFSVRGPSLADMDLQMSCEF